MDGRGLRLGQPRGQDPARDQGPGQAQDPGIGQGPRAATTSPRGLQPLRQKPLPEAITTCSPATFTAAGVSATVNAPFTVTLRDLTPGSGQSSPDVPLSTSAGITGHRVTKEIRLKLTVLDASQQEPTYPVLVTMALAGSAPGSLILDPDGARVRCRQARFLWHERDALGNLLPQKNEEIGYELGTFAAYVGAAPDPSNPGQVKAVWGTTEALGVQITSPDPSGSQDQSKTLNLTFPVHPEPWKPDHLATANRIRGLPEDDIYEFWADYLFSPGGTIRHLSNAYYLLDAYGNQTFGYTETAASTTASGTTVSFRDQTHGDGSSAAFNGYEMDLTWTSRLQGDYPETLSVTYPTDADWSGGTVSQPVTLRFVRGTQKAVVPHWSYEARFGADDGGAMNVSPGATTGSLPTTAAGDTKRTVLLTIQGTKLDAGTLEVFQDPHTIWRQDNGAWVSDRMETPEDPRLEVQDQARLKLSIVDEKGNVAPDAEVVVHSCPRFDHEGPNPPDGLGRACTDNPVTSINGVIAELIVNNDPVADNNRGYLGVELTKAPIVPGGYSVKVGSLDGTYRIKDGAGQWTSNVGSAQGAFGLCRVINGEFLDQNFARVTDTLEIASPKTVYLRYVLPDQATDSLPVSLASVDSANQTDYTGSTTLRRLGRSSTFISDPIEVDPPPDAFTDAPAPPTSPHRSIGSVASGITAVNGPGTLLGTPQNQPPATMTTLTDLVFDFRIGTLSSWQEPNLLFADGREYSDMSVRITYADGKPLPQSTVVSIQALPGEGTVSVLAALDSDGRVKFRYTAPSIAPGTVKGFLRPHFVFNFKRPSDQSLIQYSKTQTARPFGTKSEKVCAFKHDAEANSHCYWDPNFPVVWSYFDFRDLVFFPGNKAPAHLTDQGFISTAWQEPEIQQFLVGKKTLLARTYFVGSDELLGDPDSKAYSTRGRPASEDTDLPGYFIDINGDGTYTPDVDIWKAPPGNLTMPAPQAGAAGVPFARILDVVCYGFDVSAKVLLTKIQGESSTVHGPPGLDPSGLPLTALLPHLIGYGYLGPGEWDVRYLWPTLQVGRAAASLQDNFVHAPQTTLPASAGSIHSGELTPAPRAYEGGSKFTVNIYMPRPPHFPAVFFQHSKASYSLYKYTNWVSTLNGSGGADLFMKLWAQYGFDE